MNLEPSLSPEVARLARAIRFALVSLILALSYFTICAAVAITGFAQIFHDMMNGKPLPALTMFVVHTHYLLLACAWLVPLLAFGTLFSRRLVASFYVLGGLCFLVVALFLFIYKAVSIPMFQIVTSMQGG